MTELVRAGTREQILQAALELFTQRGYDSTSLRQIAEQQGLTKAALYYHFPAKEQLLLELTRPFLDGLSDLVTEHRARAAPDAETLLSSYLDLFIDHLEIVGLLVSDPATLNHPDIGQRGRALVQAARQLLTGADATSNEIVRATCALGVINAVAQLPVDALNASRTTILEAAMGALGSSGPVKQVRRAR